MQKRLPQFAALLLLFAPLASWGQDSDRSEPIYIEADRAMLDEKQEISVYDGNVQLRQGSFMLQGESMTVYLANKQVDRIILTGKPASMQQRRDGRDIEQHAEAESIDYNTRDEQVILLGSARIWQDGEDEFRSERIVYNLKDSTVNAGGKGSKDRVHIILQPKVETQGSEEKINNEPTQRK